MPKLKITIGEAASEFELVRPVLTAGRLPGLDLTLNVREASREHFRIGKLKDGGWAIKDLDSTNGTKLNGEPVKAARLKHKDTIQVGLNCSIVFWDPPPPRGPIVLKTRQQRLKEEREAKREHTPEPASEELEAAPAPEPEPEPAPPPPEAIEITSESQLDELMRNEAAFDKLLEAGPNEVHFGPYRIIKRLSAGGMGVVFKAIHRKRKLIVALKVLRTDMVDEQNVARFQQEAWAISAFDHPNIVKVRDLSRHGGMHYIAMDFIDGQDLLAAGFKRELTFWQIMEAIDKLASVLKLVHARNIWHRDIKPQNVLMDRKGEIKLIDFGIATVEREQTDATKTADGLIMGTPAFLSPEQAARGRMGAIDGRADLYSLGAVLYYLLTGRRPFTGRSPLEVLRRNMTKKPAHPHSIEPLAPAGLCDICMRLLEKHPEDRYQSAEELQAALAKWRKTRDGREELERHKKIMKLRERKARLRARQRDG